MNKSWKELKEMGIHKDIIKFIKEPKKENKEYKIPNWRSWKKITEYLKNG